MKHTRKHDAGFTLVELIVAMAIAVIVTAAATSVLLMGLRVNRQTGDTASQQMTVRSLLKVLEDVAADGNITAVESDIIDPETEEKKYGSWALKGENEKIIFLYDADNQTIYTNEIPVLEGVIASNAIMEGKLLSVSIETKDGIYTSSIYCRTAQEATAPELDDLPGVAGQDGRGKFIEILKKEYRSRGEIKNGDGQYKYYSEWYIQGYTGKPGWNSKTPWCACYISWALVQVEKIGGPDGRWYANVDDFLEYFTPKDATATATEKWIPGGGEPQAGDLIFFDWDKGTDPEHVGVVLDVKTNGGATIVYTIEGNSSGRVTIRSYTLNDPRIIGYGVLSWK